MFVFADTDAHATYKQNRTIVNLNTGAWRTGRKDRHCSLSLTLVQLGKLQSVLQRFQSGLLVLWGHAALQSMLHASLIFTPYSNLFRVSEAPNFTKDIIDQTLRPQPEFMYESGFVWRKKSVRLHRSVRFHSNFFFWQSRVPTSQGNAKQKMTPKEHSNWWPGWEAVGMDEVLHAA